MAAETLDFEEPIAVLLKEIEALSVLPRTDGREREIAALRGRVESVRTELYAAPARPVMGATTFAKLSCNCVCPRRARSALMAPAAALTLVSIPCAFATG